MASQKRFQFIAGLAKPQGGYGSSWMRGALFDLDGTLADTSADLLAAANKVLAPRGMPTLDPVGDRIVAGRGGKSMLRRSLEIAGRHLDDPDELALVDSLYPHLLDAYEEALAVHTRLFDGVERCLDALSDRGWAVGVCTNKPEYLAVPLLQHLGVAERFGAILGADTLAVRKPNPLHVTETARRIGADPARSVMIGDTATDRNAARNAGIPCVLTSFGFAAEPIESLAPDATIDHFDELASLLETLGPISTGA